MKSSGTNNNQFCPQCKKHLNGPLCRLVKDSCGHKKCRYCLLLDEEKCQQCVLALNNYENDNNVRNCDIKYKSVIICNGATTKNHSYMKDESYDSKSISAKNSVLESGGKLDIKDTSSQAIQLPIGKECQSDLPSHIVMLDSPSHYKCNICSKQFTTKTSIKHHLYCIGGTKPFRCEYCPRDFASKAQLNAHTIRHTENKAYTCKICTKSFHDRSKLKRHMILHNSLKPFVCSVCGKAFARNESLKLHMIIHRGEKPYHCKLCSAKFTNSSNLKKHLVSHSSDKMYMCDECGSTFKLKWTLTEHRRVHLQIRPYQCSVCGVGFVYKKELQRHQLIHLANKPFRCSICNTTFRRKDSLIRHARNTHPGLKADPCTETVKQLINKTVNISENPSRPIDNPNAIKVITASPICTKQCEDKPNRLERRTAINGPIKLAFKTSAFRNNYNINRSCNFDHTIGKVYDITETANIYQRILSPSSSSITTVKSNNTAETSSEICQKILSTYNPSVNSRQCENSFHEADPYSIVKNIKFKLPTHGDHISKPNNSPSNFVTLTNVPMEGNVSKIGNETDNDFQELLAPSSSITTSVIVNSNYSNVHWRRRTLDNLQNINNNNN